MLYKLKPFGRYARNYDTWLRDLRDTPVMIYLFVYNFTDMREKKRAVVGLDTSLKGLIREACNGKVN